ncbi:hypothetical protein HCG51_02885 [Tolypothrix sp. PCC 7910]|nr:hypothetical protein [Tolypothrix sp. PCC 7910]QIR35802.1 hypothetical protein HCG51_02885 [Tolypothrix sp. PCC 7910]
MCPIILYYRLSPEIIAERTEEAIALINPSIQKICSMPLTTCSICNINEL